MIAELTKFYKLHALILGQTPATTMKPTLTTLISTPTMITSIIPNNSSGNIFLTLLNYDRCLLNYILEFFDHLQI